MQLAKSRPQTGDLLRRRRFPLLLTPAGNPSALRLKLPEPQGELLFDQGAPPLFVRESARQGLEKRLGTLMGEKVSLSITDNRRTMIGSQRRGGTAHLRLHHMFLDADAFTVQALARYLKRGDRHASRVLGTFIETHRQRIRPRHKRPSALKTTGEHHDLKPLFAHLNATYFSGAVDANITWGRHAPAKKRGRKRSRQTIRLGTYCPEEKLIRIHPALDQAWVPSFFVEYVLFHEMLHHVVPMPLEKGRLQFHTPEFRAYEERYPHYQRALRWEKKHVERLLLAR